jgi:VIT1/CCC1 family predicted Fe2+/Mn2+ transporter
MALNPRAWLDALRTIEQSHRAIMEKQAEQIQDLKDRLTKLEAHVQAREEILVAEAKGAAAAVASTVATQHIASIAQSVGRLQGRLDRSTGRLPSSGHEQD